MAVTTDEEGVGEGVTRFAVDLYRALARDRSNLVFSPSSIFTALAMTLAGAAGRTATQMADVLHLDMPPGQFHRAVGLLNRDLHRCDLATGVALEVANSLWPQEGDELLPGFVELLTRHYGAPPQMVDYRRDPDGARQAINAWVSDHTAQMIPALLRPEHVNPSTVLILVSAIYHGAAWRSPFDPKRTREAPFACADGREVPVAMMSQTAHLDYTHHRAGYRAIEVPYADDDLAMVVILPDLGRLRDFEASLDAQMLGEVVGSLNPTTVVLSMPRFALSTNVELSGMLKELGMVNAFSSRANFSAMSPDGMWIGPVPHEGRVDVDEHGSTASAATAVVGTRRAPPRMVVDRPFLFLIHHRPTGTPLFFGRVLDPAE